VTGMLLLGGSAVINALTGMNIYAASFLIPLGIILYTSHRRCALVLQSLVRDARTHHKLQARPALP